MNSNIYIYHGGQPDPTQRHGITHVIVSDGVSFIIDEAFKDWKDLVSVHLPSSMLRIGQRAFDGCSSLSSINLPDSLQHIGYFAFARCTSLSMIHLPHSITQIGGGAFYECTSLRSITIPPSITSIETITFKSCSSLSKVIIPPSVIRVGQKAFRNCGRMKSILMPNGGIESIDHWAFEDCISLESIHIPPSVTNVYHDAFKCCTSLKVVYAPSSSALANRPSVFYGCSNMIILTDINDFQYGGHPTITLNNIQQCIDDLPNNNDDDIAPTPDQQLHTLNILHHILHQRFPRIAKRTERSSLNILHLLIYFPGDIYQPLLTLLEKCPQAMTAVDSTGRTPLHHAMTFTRQIMDPNCFDLLLRRSPHTVVHLAIKSGRLWDYDVILEMVYAKINSLSIGDGETGLLPFMLAAEDCNDLEGLSMAYELLCMNPGVLKGCK